MNHLSRMLNASLEGREGRVRSLRLGDPLGSTLSTFDFHNHRIKLYDITADRFIGSEPGQEVVEELEKGKQFSKLTLYTLDPPGTQDKSWKEAGFRMEGVIRSFYADDSDAVLWARYSDQKRAVEPQENEHEKVLEIARTKTEAVLVVPGEFRMRRAVADDAEPISALLQDVFTEYPSETSAEHLAKHIATQRSVFHIVEAEDRTLVAAVSAELDVRRRNAEITDCVTRPDARGKGLSTAAVLALQKDLKSRYRIDHAYSLARAGEVGINCVFHRLGYEYTGRLVNNCRMPEGWESMNVWCGALES